MEKNCAIYARVSTLIHGQSTTNQTVPLKDLASRRGFRVVGEYLDEGISGVKDSRPALNKLIKDAKLGKFKILLCYSIDRLGRSTKHLINLLDDLSHYGVTPIFIRENIDLSMTCPPILLPETMAIKSLNMEVSHGKHSLQ